MNFDKQIKKALGKTKKKNNKNNPFSFNTKQKTNDLFNLAKGSVFFPFTQPTVRSPKGTLIKGNMPRMNNVLKNFGFKPMLPKSKDWDGDGVPNWKDCQPRNPMRQDPRKQTEDDSWIAKKIVPTGKGKGGMRFSGALLGIIAAKKKEREEREMLEEDIYQKTKDDLSKRMIIDDYFYDYLLSKGYKEDEVFPQEPPKSFFPTNEMYEQVEEYRKTKQPITQTNNNNIKAEVQQIEADVQEAKEKKEMEEEPEEEPEEVVYQSQEDALKDAFKDDDELR